MRYPKECFCINENVTRNAMREYEMKRKLWYDKAEELYPNYFEMDVRDRLKAREVVNDEIGFRI